MNDEQLIEAIDDNDESAFVEFVTRYRAPLQRFVGASVGHRAVAEDIVQETFLAVLEGAGTFEASGSCRSWLFSIARHRIARQFRRRAGEPDAFESLEELGLKAGWGDPEAGAVLGESRERIQEAFDGLDPAKRQVLILRDVEQWTNPEVADLLDLSIPAVKSRVHRARLALMAELRTQQEDQNGT
jgi:RNA polymerase sigma-70 factor (ECF subfamily)